jgi:hypothetical protein
LLQQTAVTAIFSLQIFREAACRAGVVGCGNFAVTLGK